MNGTEQWSSKIGFILAAAGAAIGLGAIWKFPYVAGTSGGGAFFLLFLIFTLFIGLPLLLAEFVIGRSTGKEAISAYQAIAPGTHWDWIGKMGVFSCTVLLSFYSVVGGWVLLYTGMSVIGFLVSPGTAYDALFNQIISNPFAAVGSQLLFLLLNIVVIARGVQKGIEKMSKYLMPALFIFFIILVIRSLTLEGAMAGVSFFLKPDFSKITGETALFALGQSFFSLCVGLSCMVTYSSYLSKKESLTRSAGIIAIFNIIVSILAGLAIFPAVFSFGLEPAEGPGLLFIVLPAVFSQMPFGSLFLFLFLILFLFATLTSSFSLLEIGVASLSKGDINKRKKTTWIVGFIVAVLGIPSALSYGVLNNITLFGKNIFDCADYLVSNILLPLGALSIAIFVPLKMKREVLMAEFIVGSPGAKRWFGIWLLLLRYVLPIAIIVVFLNMIGIF
ncbi:sodium-dependent transporter [Paenibacillus faecalis]|uniref:sodium-dependent transporter n=1 Tax=Paenibacillus faecalis TaxID=2079532 RepID=UPI000D0FBB47|nr:sodium-dependent transporter [Paenibacillus faecalis]